MTGVAIESVGLGKRYGRRWALRDCTLTVPQGRVVGLVGPNGAGKTTLLQLAVGLLRPTSGTITVLGDRPGAGARELARVGFVAQDTPLYARLRVTRQLQMAAWLNAEWDHTFAAHRLDALGIDRRQRIGTLSGGQRAQLALTIAMAKRPDLLILDEPVASLDPLARREFLQDLMAEVAAQGISVVLSSHLVSDLQRVCDYMVVLVDSQVRLVGDLDHLLETHHRLSGPRRDPATLPPTQHVIEASHTDKQTVMLVHSDEPIYDPNWTITPVTLEDIVLAHMKQKQSGQRRRNGLEVAR